MPDDLQPPVIPPVPLVPKVDEHPISDADAKQFSGMGDYHLPVVKDSAVTDQVKPEPNAAVPPKVEMPVVGSPAVVDLEEKAKDMLKTLEPTKKKSRSRAATRMVLAAVLVVLMGAGGFVGMKLSLMPGIADLRQQALGGQCEGKDACCNKCKASEVCDNGVCKNPGAGGGGGSGDPGETSCMTECRKTKGELVCQCRCGGSCERDDVEPDDDNNPSTPCNTQECIDWRLRESGAEIVISPISSSGCPDNYYACGGTGRLWSFCLLKAAGKTCNESAFDQGFVVPLGIVACRKTGSTWEYDPAAYPGGITEDGAAAVTAHCQQACATNDTCPFGQGAYICPPGTPIACTANNGTVYSGNPQTDCFCGVIQVDTGNGHMSYRSNCGCGGGGGEEEEEENSFQCVSLAKSVVAPKIGDAITFTCNGSATGTTINHYEYQYKVGAGAYTRMTSPTLTVSQIGVHTVQCRACTSADSTSCTSWGLAQ